MTDTDRREETYAGHVGYCWLIITGLNAWKSLTYSQIQIDIQ